MGHFIEKKYNCCISVTKYSKKNFKMALRKGLEDLEKNMKLHIQEDYSALVKQIKETMELTLNTLLGVTKNRAIKVEESLEKEVYMLKNDLFGMTEKVDKWKESLKQANDMKKKINGPSIDSEKQHVFKEEHSELEQNDLYSTNEPKKSSESDKIIVSVSD